MSATCTRGYMFSVCHVLSIGEGDVVDGEDQDGFEVTVRIIVVDEDNGGWRAGVIMDVFSQDMIFPGSYPDLYQATYTIDGSEAVSGSTTGLEFCESIGDGDNPPIVGAPAGDVSPATVDGTIDIQEAFLRGDADGSGDFFAIVDVLHILEFGFSDGAEPPCLDAADADDNGDVEPLVDALYMLDYGFTDGPEPPSPGPSECGGDPTEDELGCLTEPEECQ